MYGLGNWGEVSEHVGTKTKTQCYDHYMTTYMNSICSPLPVSAANTCSLISGICNRFPLREYSEFYTLAIVMCGD